MPNVVKRLIINAKGASFGTLDAQIGIERHKSAVHKSFEAVEHRHYAHQRHGADGHAAHRNQRDDVDGVVRLFREKIALRHKERPTIFRPKTHGRGCLLVQQFVDMLEAVERFVEFELQLRHYAQLVAHAVA